MLADYQDRASGGEGWLRILRFVPAEDKVYVQTYSPWLNRFETDANSEFTLDFPMGGAFDTPAHVDRGERRDRVHSHLRRCEPNTDYEWQVTVTNASGKSRTGPVWRFTTGIGRSDQPAAHRRRASRSARRRIRRSAITLDRERSGGRAADLHRRHRSDARHAERQRAILTYQPAANYNGTDAFTFRVNDGQLTARSRPSRSPAGSERCTVGGRRGLHGPEWQHADGDGARRPGQRRRHRRRHARDTTRSGPANGSLNLNANGSLTYTPTAGYSGPDAFSYRASDGLATSSAVIVGLTVTPAPPADTTAPIVTLTSPSAGTVSGNVTVSATATDTVGVVGVQFLLNGSPIGPEDTTAPYSIAWNSTSVANGGPYLLSARARDELPIRPHPRACPSLSAMSRSPGS